MKKYQKVSSVLGIAIIGVCCIGSSHGATLVESFTGGFITTDNGSSVRWSNLGDADWLGSSTAGVGALTGDYFRSGSIGDYDISTLRLDVVLSGAGSLSYDWAVSSETNYDFIYVNANGVNITNASGATNGSVTNFALTAGANQIDFIYDKDYSVSSRLDLAGIDNVTVTNVVPISGVPESSFTTLLGLGGLALMLRRRR